MILQQNKLSLSPDPFVLDMIISVGYRVNSLKATHFRQWATSVLREYINSGYAINSERITVDRFVSLEHDVVELKKNMTEVVRHIKSNQVEIKQGIFCNGQIFDAYVFVNGLLKGAKRDVVLVDNYVDDTVLTLLSKYPDIRFAIITKNISKHLKLDLDKYNSQYNNITIKTSNRFHDRFLILDDEVAYHLGASFKDLGKKIFGFNVFDIDLIREMMEGIK